MAIGDSDDIVRRLKTQIPRGWFASAAAVRNAVFGGAADIFAWIYALIGIAKLQMRLATAQGYFLDLTAYDYFAPSYLRRKSGQGDDVFRARIKKALLRERVTRRGMIDTVADLTGTPPIVLEPWSTQDCAAIGYTFAAGDGFPVGSLQYPNQFFMTVFRPKGVGIPDIAGVQTYAGGIEIGALTPVSFDEETGITDDDIYREITVTKPTGNIAWVTFGHPGVPPSYGEVFIFGLFNDQFVDYGVVT